MRRIRLGQQMVDLGARTVSAGEDVVHLSPREAALLRYLAERPGQLVGREALLAEVWAYQPGVVTRTIDNTVRRLRVKLEDDPSNPRFLHSRYGRGLVLEGIDVVDDQPTTLVARDDELARGMALLRTESVVTLIGPAGVGKTRLAAEIAGRVPQVVVRIGCASVRQRGELDLRLLAAMGSESHPVDALRSRSPLVLWLDECETAVEVIADTVRAWTAAAPGVRVLATSRIPLGLPSEQLLTVAPLDPEPAASLFLDRAARRDVAGFDRARSRPPRSSTPSSASRC